MTGVGSAEPTPNVAHVDTSHPANTNGYPSAFVRKCMNFAIQAHEKKKRPKHRRVGRKGCHTVTTSNIQFKKSNNTKRCMEFSSPQILLSLSSPAPSLLAFSNLLCQAYFCLITVFFLFSAPMSGVVYVIERNVKSGCGPAVCQSLPVCMAVFTTHHCTYLSLQEQLGALGELISPNDTLKWSYTSNWSNSTLSETGPKSTEQACILTPAQARPDGGDK